MKLLVNEPGALRRRPRATAKPPLWIRGLLILTCTGVSFAHGSNDGQKGMGLIMLILIGTVPTAYALNRSLPASHIAELHRARRPRPRKWSTPRPPATTSSAIPRPAVTAYISRHEITEGTYPSLAVLIKDISSQVKTYGSLAKVPLDAGRQHP